jgi:FkbM family methyltransferase
VIKFNNIKKMSTAGFINKHLQFFKIQIKKFPPLDWRRRIALIRNQNINIIMDIGANTGQYGMELRKIGYSGEIISFEPLTQAFKRLSEISSRDEHWRVYNYALGDNDGEATINISKNSASSSILDILPFHYENAENAEYMSREPVKLYKLDTIFDNHYQIGDKIFVKIDTQGYEKRVLEGALNSIPKIAGFQIELSLVPLYKDSPLFFELIEYLNSLGFSLFSVENGFYEEKTGRLLQLDGIFFRDNN